MNGALAWLRQHQKGSFLVASGLSTAGSFAGLTAKGWILLQESGSPLLLAINFAALALPALVVSGPAGVLTDRLGSERVLIRSQWGLFAGAVLGALAIPLLQGSAQVLLLLLSTLLVGVASTYELTARNKYTALLVDEPGQLAPYLASFSVTFNVGKLVGPPIGGALVALTGPAMALAIDAASYLLPIATVLWLLQPHRGMERRSRPGPATSLITAWRECGPALRHVLRFTALACLLGFFHPGLAPLIATALLGPSPQALGWFTASLAAGSICGGLILQRHSHELSRRPGQLLGGCCAFTAVAQLGMAAALQKPAGPSIALGLAMTFAIGAGTAALLAGTNLITQVGAPLELRGRMAGLGQISFLGGGGLSGIVAALICTRVGIAATFALLGLAGLGAGMQELARWHTLRLEPR
ncbi:MAG: MFS transporter [Cyanobium sp.]